MSIDIYIKNLIKEMSLYQERLKDYSLETIFIGGGTPSAIDDKYITKIIENIYKVFNVKNSAEVSMEINPGTITREKAMNYKKAGINRVSIGLQTLNDKLLKAIGRIHTADDFYKTISILRDVGFDNINTDLMFGLPSQTMDDLMGTLNRLIKLNVEHISLYGLIIEEDTLFNQWHRKGLMDLPDEELERDMYHKSIKLLGENAYNHYEISNFSKADKICKHNLVYWNVEPYLGVGLASHSNLSNKRFWNYIDFKQYNDSLNLMKFPVEDEEVIDRETEIAEYCIMNLRLIDGIDKNKFKSRFGIDIDHIYKDIIEKHKNNHLLEEDKRCIRLTNKGLDLSNLVEVDFI